MNHPKRTEWSKRFTAMDSSFEPIVSELYLPFAIDEWMGKKVGAGAEAFIHLWRFPKGLVIGLRDSRLPHAERALLDFGSGGWGVAVRNSGGAAVPLDEGVLNVSIILPLERGNLDFHDDFEFMIDFIRESLRVFGIAFESGEVQGAYCPGDYDLSIGGRKFCGISQRRQRSAFIIQAFIVVEGKAEDRAEAARRFYQTASGKNSENSEHSEQQEVQRGEEAVEEYAEPHTGPSRAEYPVVRTGTMASLQELVKERGTNITVQSLSEAMKQVIVSRGGNLSSAHAEELAMTKELSEMIEQLRQRYLPAAVIDAQSSVFLRKKR